MTTLEGRLLLNGALVPGRITFAGGRIESVEELASVPDTAPVIAPGFIDLHIHGFGGFDPIEDLAGMSTALARAGTTAFQPTMFPRHPEALGGDCAVVWGQASDAPGARPVGLHLEGPFLNPGSAGAIPVEDLVAPTVAGLRAILGPATGDGRGVRTVTVAPEVAGASDVIEELVRCGVRVSLGHSLATDAEARVSARAGASGVTHLYNAMTGLHHRSPGLVATALTERVLYAEIIGDLVHVGKTAFEVALAARGPGGLCLVSDALRGAGTGCEVFHSHGREHQIIGGTAYYPPREPGGEPQLAGSASSQLEMVRKLTGEGVCGLADALVMAAETPARALGMGDELGVLRPGARADLVVLAGKALALEAVYVGGQKVG
ncbi:MAG: amidohydrolase family protein [bacterium]|nr:amidohydrolase family protein [bacterium]